MTVKYVAHVKRPFHLAPSGIEANRNAAAEQCPCFASAPDQCIGATSGSSGNTPLSSGSRHHRGYQRLGVIAKRYKTRQ